MLIIRRSKVKAINGSFGHCLFVISSGTSWLEEPLLSGWELNIRYLINAHHVVRYIINFSIYQEMCRKKP